MKTYMVEFQGVVHRYQGTPESYNRWLRSLREGAR